MIGGKGRDILNDVGGRDGFRLYLGDHAEGEINFDIVTAFGAGIDFIQVDTINGNETTLASLMQSAGIR